MMSILKKLSAPFAALDTRFRNRATTDPFFSARLKIMVLYWVAGFVVFGLIGWTLGHFARLPLYQVALLENSPAAQEQIDALERMLIFERVFMMVLFAGGAYFLTDYVLRPIKKSAEFQKNFIAIVSHELRTPVTIMKNAAEVALRHQESITREKALALIKSNLEETNRLSDTIHFLLTLSTLQAQHKLSDIATLSLRDVAHSVIDRMEELAALQGVTLVLEATQPAMVLGNRTAVEGMLVNLIRNAIAHSPRGSRVIVRVIADDTHVQLSVVDSGAGISKKDLPYIFEPFYRGKNHVKNQSADIAKGTGLGLSVVREVVKLHGASISFSPTEGNGSTFSVTFPV